VPLQMTPFGVLLSTIILCDAQHKKITFPDLSLLSPIEGAVEESIRLAMLEGLIILSPCDGGSLVVTNRGRAYLKILGVRLLLKTPEMQKELAVLSKTFLLDDLCKKIEGLKDQLEREARQEDEYEY
jgi:hypothetical protein